MSSTTTYIRNGNGHFQCPHCPKVCEKQNTMYYHMKKNHCDDSKYVCEFCKEGEDRKFVQKGAYLQHMASMHPETTKETENPYAGVSFTCPHPSCDQTAKTKANILVHFARSHCKDWIPAYNKSCCGCTKEFASSTAYFYHAISCIKPVPEQYAEMIKSV